MTIIKISAVSIFSSIALLAFASSVSAATTVQVGTSGKTYASDSVICAANPATDQQEPMVEAGLFNPRTTWKANVSLNGLFLESVNFDNPTTQVWLADGNNTVVVALNKRNTDSYTFSVQPGMCELPDTSGNTFSSDGSLEYAASGKSYLTVTPGCALNPKTGQAQPFVNLFDNGNYVLNVSVNGVPLTQLSATRPRTPIFLNPGNNVISATNGSLSTDYFVRDTGNGSCTLP